MNIKLANLFLTANLTSTIAGTTLELTTSTSSLYQYIDDALSLVKSLVGLDLGWMMKIALKGELMKSMKLDCIVERQIQGHWLRIEPNRTTVIIENLSDNDLRILELYKIEA